MVLQRCSQRVSISLNIQLLSTNIPGPVAASCEMLDPGGFYLPPIREEKSIEREGGEVRGRERGRGREREREKERERDREREKEKETKRERVCVCMCE